jgi:hypothetical protein
MFAVLCALLFMLWVRSFFVQYTVFWPAMSDRAFYAHSVLGRICIGSQFRGNMPAPPFAVYSTSLEPLDRDSFDRNDGRFGFNVVTDKYYSTLLLPHWFVLCVAITLAAVPWIRWQYSMQTLLIVIALVAIVLGAMVIVGR